jgi:Zn-dependent peptidase ImmA (M78 family)/transcriptional regulator with XRE-family HTH domain
LGALVSATPETPDDAAVYEARAALPLFDGHRLRLAREALGFTQHALAEVMGERLTAAAVSQFERGDAKPSAASLAKLAVATGFPPAFFAREPAMGDVVSTDGFFRSLRSTGVRQRRRHRAKAELVRLVALGLERFVKLPDRDVPRIPVATDATRDDVEFAARRVRELWSVPPGPIDHVIRTVERHGIVVARMLLESDTVDAFSVPFRDRPLIVLGSDKARPDRSRWDCVHELSHLVMHDPDPQRSRHLEDQANWFAAEFLLPASELRDRLPATAEWSVLADLKVSWGVSMTALLQRAKALGVMPEAAYVQALKTMSTRGWNRREPVQLPTAEAPVLLSRAAQLLERTGTTLAQLSVEIGLPSTLVADIIGASADPRPHVEF